MSLTVCLLTAILNPQSGTTSDLSEPTALSAVVRELSSRLGQNLTVSPSLAGRVMILRGEGPLGRDVLPLIARAVCGRWEEGGDGQRLVVDTERQKAEERSLMESRTKGIDRALRGIEPSIEGPSAVARAEALLRRIESLVTRGTGTIHPETVARDSGLLPAGALCRELLKSIGPSSLAAIKNGEYVAYCTTPAGGEKALPRRGHLAIQNLREMSGVLADLLANMGAPAGMETIWHTMLAASRGLEERLEVILVVSRSDEFIGARCELFGAENWLETGFCTIEPAAHAVAVELANKRVPLSERSKLARDCFSAGLNGERIETDSLWDRAQILSSPAEPLQFLVREAVLGLHDGPIVACLPDSAFRLALRASAADAVDCAEFARSLQRHGIVAEPIGDCLLLRPAAPSLTQGQGEFRRATQDRLLAHRKERSIPAIDYFLFNDVADRAVGSLSPIARLYPSVLAASGWRILRPIRIHPSAHRFLESLASAQLRGLERGQAQLVELLSPAQQSRFRDWLTFDVFGKEPFARTGARRLQQSKGWRLEIEVTRSPSLLARPMRSDLGDLSRVPESLISWRNRLAGWSKETGSSPADLAQAAEWWAVQVENWSIRVSSQSGAGATANLAWSVSGPPKFRKWSELEKSTREAVIPPE